MFTLPAQDRKGRGGSNTLRVAGPAVAGEE